MAGEETSSPQPGPVISEVLARYLEAEKARLAPSTHSRYAEVIALLKDSLNAYAANALGAEERRHFERYCDAEGASHREFCDLFGPEHILPNAGAFLGYFMVRKVLAGADLLRASGTVVKKLANWLAAQGYVSVEDAAQAVAQGAKAARDLPAAERASKLLYEATLDASSPRESDIESHFEITRIERGRLWLEDFLDGSDYGMVRVPEAASALCRVGWTLSGTVRRHNTGWRLVEVFQVYP